MKAHFTVQSMLAALAFLFLSACQTEETILPIHDTSLPFNERVAGTFSGNLQYDGEAFAEPGLDYTVKIVEAVTQSEDILIDGLLFQVHTIDYPNYDFVRFIHNVESPAYATFTFSTAAMKFDWVTADESIQGTLYLR